MSNFPQFAIEKLQSSANPVANEIAIAITGATAKTGTMKQWFQDRNGKCVHTVQVDKTNNKIWTPVNRKIDSAKFASKVLLNDSARDYAGMRVIGTSHNCLIVADNWHIIAYVTTEQDER